MGIHSVIVGRREEMIKHIYQCKYFPEEARRDATLKMEAEKNEKLEREIADLGGPGSVGTPGGSGVKRSSPVTGYNASKARKLAQKLGAAGVMGMTDLDRSVTRCFDSEALLNYDTVKRRMEDRGDVDSDEYRFVVTEIAKLIRNQ